MGTQGIGVFGIDSKFASGSLVFYEKTVGRTATGDVFTIGTAAVKVGNTSQDVDFQFYGTGSISAIIDCGATSFTLTGINSTLKGTVTVGISGTGHDVTFYGDTASCNFLWDQDGDTNGSLTLGADTKSCDFRVYGVTTGKILHWDGSADALYVDGLIAPKTTDTCALGSTALMFSDLFLASGGVINFNNGDVTLTHAANLLTFGGGAWNTGADGAGVDTKLFGGTASCYLEYDASEDKLNIIQTNAATTGVETSFNNSMTLTGIGASAESAVSSITINTAAGTYTNALCARMTYGASGRTTGLGGVICSELNLSAGTSSGTYALFEGEMIMASGALTGTATSVLNVNVSGAAAGTFDDNGFLLDIQGVTSGAADFFYTNAVALVNCDAFLKIRVGATIYYIPLCDNQAGT
jgi:hypothetical protein